MFLVILYHSEVYYPVGETSCSWLFAFFRMPFFFFLSGYLFTSDYENFSLKRKIGQILRGIVWTYLVFTLILLLPKAYSNGFSAAEGLAQIALGYASWFVVALGVAQLIFAVILKHTKNLKIIFGAMLVSLACGYVVKQFHAETLPYQLDKASITLFYLGLGFFYRIYEDRISASMKKSVWLLLSTAVLYFGSTYLDSLYLHTTPNVFGANEYHNFVLYLLYSLLGIAMMLELIKLLPPIKALSFIGVNSLVFYYLNGGAIKILRTVYNRLGLHLPETLTDQAGYMEVLFMAVSACACIAVVVLLIKKYCPILTGDKQAFNALAAKMRLKIEF